MIRKILILALAAAAIAIAPALAAPASAQYCTPTTGVNTVPDNSLPLCQTTVTTSDVGGNTQNQGNDDGGVGGNDDNLGPMADTGSNADNLVRIGGVLLLAGGALTLAAGKRRRRSSPAV